MPHVIIEYARDALATGQSEPLLEAVHNAAMFCGLFEAGHVKTRAVAIDHYRVGTGKHPFIHVQLRIKAGRSAEQKSALSDAILVAVRQLGTLAKVVTVELVDMDPDSYAKYLA
jgi:5-carboxymethyl-2-hydroxymuconate isomerase